ILHGYDRGAEWLTSARETESFWNLFFLDREHRGAFFRVYDDGTPNLQGGYGVRGGHSDAAGYHVFELNFLAHIYTRTYVRAEGAGDPSFCLYFKPNANCQQKSINVLPDFFPPGAVQVTGVSIDGVPRDHPDPDNFQIDLDEADLGATIVVQF